MQIMQKEIMKRKRAAVFSAIVPGLGQWYRGRVFAALFIEAFLAGSVYVLVRVWNGYNFGFVLFLLFILIYWVYNIFDAYAGPFQKSAPCERDCPVGIDIPGYIGLIVKNQLKEAKELIYHRTPFVGSLAYVCHAPCMLHCTRRGYDNPVEIRALKRYIVDNTGQFEFNFPRRFEERIAVVGAGASGLSAAYFLSRVGYRVHVFEKSKSPGGALAQYIPLYRLPAEILKQDIEEILSSSNVVLKTGMDISGNGSLEQLIKHYDAVYISTGAHRESKLNIKGEDLNNVMHALSFLANVRNGKYKKIYGMVVVIGGGDVAVDAARTAARLSVHKGVKLVYRRRREDMKADEKAIVEMEEEGVEVLLEMSPISFKDKAGDGVVNSVVLQKNSIERDGTVTYSGELVEINADMVIVATGQYPFPMFSTIEYDAYERIIVKKNMETNIHNVFAGGDVVRGSSSLVDALGDGRKAALSIHRRLHPYIYYTKDFMYFSALRIRPSYLLREKLSKKERIKVKTLPYNKRIGSFDCVEQGYSAEDAKNEAFRCLGCPYRFRT